MSNKIDQEIVDTLRSVMYGGSEGREDDTLLIDVEHLADLLATRDGVVADLAKNRLVLAMEYLWETHPAMFSNIVHLNDKE